MVRFVDTNIFLRALTGDDPVKSPVCAALFARVERGDEEIVTCEAVIAEIVYVLSSRSIYDLRHDEIRAKLVPFIRMRGLGLPGKAVYLRALDLFVEHPALDFEDALCAAHMEQTGIGELLSYDRGLDRITGLTRVEP